MLRLKTSEEILYEEIQHVLEWYLKKEAHPDLSHVERIDAARSKISAIKSKFFEGVSGD